MKIDFILTRVDGSDPNWQREKRKYDGSSGDSRIMRYRDWDNLRYWFRGVESFAPWVNKVYFVTWGHLPCWLNTKHPKLKIIKHADYIPKEYLPTFSSRPIDMNFQRIKELSEHFVYFNDDMFLIKKVEKTDFFRKGLPCDTAVMNALCFGYGESVAKVKTPTVAAYTAPAFDMLPINKNFSKKACINKNFWKWYSPRYGTECIRTALLSPWRAFTGMMNYHLPYSYLKHTYEEVWKAEGELLDQTCKHRFRMNTDLNHWVFNYWQIAKGEFEPRSPKIGKSLWLSDNLSKNREVYEIIKNQKYKMICVNDNVQGDNFDVVKSHLNSTFETLFPRKSAFEL